MNPFEAMMAAQEPDIEPDDLVYNDTPVPDAVMEQWLEGCRLGLEAAWSIAPCSNKQHPLNPKVHVGEVFQRLHQGLVGAVSGDGADAVVGYSLVAKSLAHKVMAMHGKRPTRAVEKDEGFPSLALSLARLEQEALRPPPPLPPATYERQQADDGTWWLS